MKTKLRISFRRGDWIAIALVALLAAGTAAAFIMPDSDENAMLQIYHDGRMIHELPLYTDADFEIHGQYANQISIRDGCAAITDSDCPGQDCMHSGWIQNTGRSIVCLPNRVELRIIGIESEVDFSVG